MTLLDDDLGTRSQPHVYGELPGPRSAALLARQERRESNARVYGRHFPIAVAEAEGSFLRDVDGNVFIDFLSGAGVLSLGHNHPELVAAATTQLGLFVHGLDLPTPAKDAFVEAQLSMLPEAMRDHVKIHFCGPTGANAVDAAIKLCKTATGRGDVVSFQGGFHGTTHAGMALTGVVANKAPIGNGMPGVHFFPFSHCSSCPLDLTRDRCATNCVSVLENALRDPNGGIVRPAAVLMELVQGEGGVVPADYDFVQRVRVLTPGAGRAAGGRRGADRVRPDRDLVRVRAVRHRAGRHRGVQGAVGDRPAGRSDHVRRAVGRLGAGSPHRNVPGQPAGVRGWGGRGGHRAARRRVGQRAGPGDADRSPVGRAADPPLGP
jgi:diaminobutyrate-2-oxoglutarate transaminase